MSVTMDPTLDDPAGARPRPNRPRPAVESDPPPLLSLRANLLPDEIVAARRVDVVRRRVLLGLVALVALLVLGYAGSWWQTHTAENDLASAQNEASSLQRQVNAFGPLVTAQSHTSGIRGQLQQVMVGDLPWKSMLTTLRTNAPAGVSLTGVDGVVTIGTVASTGAAGAAGAAGAPGTQPLPAGLTQVGTLTLNGTARDERSVADYADSLTHAKSLALPFVSSVTQAQKGSVTFSMTVVITSDALGGRFKQAAASTTGTAQNGH